MVLFYFIFEEAKLYMVLVMFVILIVNFVNDF